MHLVWCEGCEKTCEKQQHTKKNHVQNPDPTHTCTRTHTLTLTQSVYRCRLTVDGIRIGELSAVTRLRMTSMVAKHCSENSVVFLFICTPLWRWPQRGERGRAWPLGSIHHSANVSHSPLDIPTHTSPGLLEDDWKYLNPGKPWVSIAPELIDPLDHQGAPSLKPGYTSLLMQLYQHTYGFPSIAPRDSVHQWEKEHGSEERGPSAAGLGGWQDQGS